MSNYNCETLILGATFYGLSRLLSSPGDCMAVERSVLVGSEYVDSLNDKGAADFVPSTEFCTRIKESLFISGALNDAGEIYAAPASFHLCELLLEKHGKILFDTSVAEIRKTRGGYEVTIFNRSGFSVISAKRIIDTTSEGVLHNPPYPALAQKNLNLIVQKPENANCGLKNLTHNSLAGIDIFKFPVGLHEDMYPAKTRLYSFWENSPDAKDSRIVYIANTFAYDMDFTCHKIDDNRYWIPSSGCGGILQAIDKGFSDEVNFDDSEG